MQVIIVTFVFVILILLLLLLIFIIDSVLVRMGSSITESLWDWKATFPYHTTAHS